MTKLRISPEISLSPDAITQTFLIVGKRGSGKSNTAAVLVEQFYHAKLPFVVLDPVDNWWGLKASRDGASRGLAVTVFGGAKADYPLLPGDGELLADVLIEHRIPMVLSVKHLSNRERNSLMTAFAKRLFQKWAGGPLHVVLEEAHELAPQNVQNGREGEQEMLGAFKRLWKLGRASGIGGSAITQRAASLSKDITTQSEILIAHRTIGPQDVKAVGEWIKYHGERLDILAELPSLPTGDAFVWSPEFPEGKPLGLLRTRVDLRGTYDSASTPKVGEKRVEPKDLAPADIEALRAKMSTAIAKAKADDPKELRKEIAALRTQLTKAQKAQPASRVVEKAVVDQVAIDRAVSRAVATAVKPYGDRLSQIKRAVHVVAGAGTKLTDAIGGLAAINFDVALPTNGNGNGNGHVVARSESRAMPERPARTSRASSRSADASLPIGERALLVAAAQYAVDGGVDRDQLSVLTGYKRSSRNTYVSRLQARGYVELSGNSIVATNDGIAALGDDFEPLPTGEALREYWLDRLPEGERKILEILLEANGEPVDRDELDEPTGYKRSSRNTYLSRLSARRVVEFVGGGQVRAAATLFEEG